MTDSSSNPLHARRTDEAPRAGDSVNPRVPTGLPPGAIPGPTSRPHLQTVARLTDAISNMTRPVTGESFERMLGAVGAALDDPSSGDRTLIWAISPDGTRMRQVSPPLEENPWIPADGAVAQVLGARRAIEMGLVVADPKERAQARSLADENREVTRAFGLFHPVFDVDRIAVVIGAIRRAGRPSFDENDRIVVRAAAERIESALMTRRIADRLASERRRGMVSASGLTLSNNLLKEIGEISGDVVIRHLFYGNGTDYVSDGIETATGYTAEEMMSDPGLLDRILHPEDRHLLFDFIEDPSIAREPLLLRLMRRDGRISWHLARLRPIHDDTGDVIGFEGLSTDVSAMKAAEAELAHQARSDPLTGLSNRLNFREATTRARIERHSGMMATLFLDLDGFKMVNDTLGHPAGDEVLREVANRLRRVIRREDLVARFGGDEFAVLLAEIRDPGEAASTARRILDALEMPIMVGTNEARISTGVGIAVTDSADSDADELISRADIALYQAKRTGRGHWQIFEGPAGTATTVQMPLDRNLAEVPSAKPGPVISEGTLRSALAGSEFRVHYLPEIDTVTSRIVGVEALVRWNHPEHGLLRAQTFIGEARVSGVIHPLGDWVVREASQQVATWRKTYGIDISLWVNVCGEQLQREGFADSVLATLASTGLPAWAFGLDIAEVDFAALDSVQERSLLTLSRAGVKLSIDDFGQGGSSLNTLRKLPLAQLKLGRAIVNAMEEPSADQTILPLTVKLANSLGATVVAIGVERFEQLRTLRTLQCGLFQGSLASDILSPEAMATLLNDGQLTIPGLQDTI
jgi:diguanylate cyclase (GGDEF)-like protein/PAS domain S-box-containing protein